MEASAIEMLVNMIPAEQQNIIAPDGSVPPSASAPAAPNLEGDLARLATRCEELTRERDELAELVERLRHENAVLIDAINPSVKREAELRESVSQLEIKFAELSEAVEHKAMELAILDSYGKNA